MYLLLIFIDCQAWSSLKLFHLVANICSNCQSTFGQKVSAIVGCWNLMHLRRVKQRPRRWIASAVSFYSKGPFFNNGDQFCHIIDHLPTYSWSTFGQKVSAIVSCWNLNFLILHRSVNRTGEIQRRQGFGFLTMYLFLSRWSKVGE